jgi:hypothetical protein
VTIVTAACERLMPIRPQRRRPHGGPTRTAARFATIGALLALALLPGCGETAQSYCPGLYHHGGVGTPRWAAKDDLFHDYSSCVEWYEDLRSQDQP